MYSLLDTHPVATSGASASTVTAARDVRIVLASCVMDTGDVPASRLWQEATAETKN
jgi:hypothetical protein